MPSSRARSSAIVVLAVLAALPAACRTPPRPEPGTSAYADLDEEDWAGIAEHNEFGIVPTFDARIDVLCISGGGQRGAFGAGILDGWPRERVGNALARPDFEVVTGVSTGALLATTAFLDDPELTARTAAMYSSIDDEDVYKRSGWLALVRNSGLAKYTGLADLIEELLTDDVIDRVGLEYAKGRALWVGTTNLDTGNFQPWNLTYLASQAERKAAYYDLYRKAILASASIPLLVEPQYLRGEMHVDGGVRRNVFAPGYMRLAVEQLGRQPDTEWHLWILINGKIGVASEPTGTTLSAIGARTLEVSMDELMVHSLVAIRDGLFRLKNEHPDVDFDRFHPHFAWIPDSYPDEPSGSAFNTDYMRALGEYGRSLAAEGRWVDSLEGELPVLER